VRNSLSCLAILTVLLAAACGDDTVVHEETTSSSSSSGTGGTTEGGGGAVSQGGAGGSHEGGAGGANEGGAGGAMGCDDQVFGPCHCITDDFRAFDPASTTDYWAVDGDAQLVTDPDGAVQLDPLADTNASSLYSDVGAPVGNCFTSVRVEQEGSRFEYFELLEATGTGLKLIIQADVGTGDYEVANVLDAGGNAESLGTGTVTALEGFRVQVLEGMLIFEVRDAGVWEQAATMTDIPDWMSGDVNIGFGTSDDPGTISIFDDFNMDDPTLD
jgi:hypothetical protein